MTSVTAQHTSVPLITGKDLRVVSTVPIGVADGLGTRGKTTQTIKSLERIWGMTAAGEFCVHRINDKSMSRAYSV